MPETGDSDFSWHEFLRRNNNELLANYGNLAHRVLTFTHRNFYGVVPSPGELDEESQKLIHKAEVALDAVDVMLHRCSFREAMREAMSLAQECNRYLDEQAPWKKIKQEPETSAKSIYTILTALSALKTMLYPFMPFSSEKLHSFLGFQGSIEEAGWRFQSPVPGQKIGEPRPLFVKLDESIVAEEDSRLGAIPEGEAEC